MFFNLNVIIIKLLTKLGSSSSTWTSSSEPESDTQSNCKSGAERTSLAVDVVWSSCQNKCHVNKLINISILLVISFQYLSSTQRCITQSQYLNGIWQIRYPLFVICLYFNDGSFFSSINQLQKRGGSQFVCFCSCLLPN